MSSMRHRAGEAASKAKSAVEGEAKKIKGMAQRSESAVKTENAKIKGKAENLAGKTKATVDRQRDKVHRAEEKIGNKLHK